MRFAVNMPNFGAFSDARALAELAHEAAEAGWDGFFLWDHSIRQSRCRLPIHGWR